MQRYPCAVQNLPIANHLDAICGTLKSSPSRFLVLTAETAAGKSTAMPLALLNHFAGKILMLEPRRIAALAVASRTAQLLGEEPGQTAGYIMHLERRVSAQTRFTVITEAVLTRMLQSDMTLEGISVVVIDEFHERSIHADLALAFLKEAMQLRDDLYVIVMSATIDTDAISRYLGTEDSPAPVYAVKGHQFPVTVSYRGNLSAADAVMDELSDTEEKGSILVFLPGIADIRRTAAELAQRGADAQTVILHSSISFSEQRKILTPLEPGERRKVILSSAIAETSLTVPGVTVVIDSGKSRINRMNVCAGMETLVTEDESTFSAEQRKGRAGRTAPGKCIRLWNEHDVRSTRTPPEILRADLLPLVLECAQWGVYERSKLSWLDAPSESAWNAARLLLIQMNCISSTITELGKAVLLLGLHPRLACVALAGSVQKALAYSNYADAAPALQKKFTDDIEARIHKCTAQFAGLKSFSVPDALFAGYPDRIARLKDASGLYQFPSGRIASLPKESRQGMSVFPEWIVAPEADAGEREGRIYKWEPADSEQTQQWLLSKATVTTHTQFTGEAHERSQKMRKTQRTCYGKIILAEKKCTAGPEDFIDAVCGEVQRQGLQWLPLSDRTQDFLTRAQFFAQHAHALPVKKSSSQDEADLGKYDREQLCLTVREWLTPFVTGATLTHDDVYNALYYHLDGATVDTHVPQRISMPNGRLYRLTYDTQSGKEVRPVLEIIIQQIFGCMDTPRVMGMPVLLRLLSPARRPLQVTDDLAGFWQNTWPEVCKEMKGRYPKHNWDYRIVQPD